MVRGLNSSGEGETEWMAEFAKGAFAIIGVFVESHSDIFADFRRRFLSLLSFKFSELGCITALSVLEAANVGTKKLDEDKSKGHLSNHLTASLPSETNDRARSIRTLDSPIAI
jgi:N-acetyltransferase 10